MELGSSGKTVLVTGTSKGIGRAVARAFVSEGSRAFLDAMQKRGSGVIVNVTGLAADRTDAGYVAGTAGNAGLNAFTRAGGGRSLSHGVPVLAVSPGPVATDRIVTLMRSRAEA